MALKNVRYETFCRLYAEGENAAAAYRLAFKDYKGKFSNTSGRRLLQRPDIRKRVDELLEQFAAQSAIKIEHLQSQMMQILLINPQDLCDEKGNFLQMSELPREVAYGVKAYKRDPRTGVVTDIVLWDKIGAATVLLRSLLGPDTNTNQVLVNLGERLDSAAKRVVDAHSAQSQPARQVEHKAHLEVGMEL